LHCLYCLLGFWIRPHVRGGKSVLSAADSGSSLASGDDVRRPDNGFTGSSSFALPERRPPSWRGWSGGTHQIYRLPLLQRGRSSLIYPVVGHWIWGGGFLQSWECSISPVLSGTTASGAGRHLPVRFHWDRALGKFNKDGSANVIVGHSAALANIGLLDSLVRLVRFQSGQHPLRDAGRPHRDHRRQYQCRSGNGRHYNGYLSKVFTGKYDLGMVTNGVPGWARRHHRHPAPMFRCLAQLLSGLSGRQSAYFAIGFLRQKSTSMTRLGAAGTSLQRCLGTIATGLFHDSQGFALWRRSQPARRAAIGRCLRSPPGWLRRLPVLFWLIKHTVGLRVTARERNGGPLTSASTAPLPIRNFK